MLPEPVSRDLFEKDRKQAVEPIRLIDKKRMSGPLKNLDVRFRSMAQKVARLRSELLRYDVHQWFAEGTRHVSPVLSGNTARKQRKARLERDAQCGLKKPVQFGIPTRRPEHVMDKRPQSRRAITLKRIDKPCSGRRRILSHR